MVIDYSLTMNKFTQLDAYPLPPTWRLSSEVICKVKLYMCSVKPAANTRLVYYIVHLNQNR